MVLPHCTNETSEVQRGCDSPKVTQPGRVGLRLDVPSPCCVIHRSGRPYLYFPHLRNGRTILLAFPGWLALS